MTRLLLPLAAAMLLAGCANVGGPVNAVTLSLSADPGLNPDPTGGANPAQVHIYLLTAPDKLNNGDYFQLAEKETTVLGDTLVGRQQLTLHPGEKTTLNVPVPANARFIGITVGYRDIDHATWRATAPVARTLAVTVGASRVAIGGPK